MRIQILTIVWILFLPFVLTAETITGSEVCFCAVTRIMECEAIGGCEEISPETANIPGFIKADFKKKRLSTVAKEDTRTTDVKNVEQDGTNFILHGSENHRAWSMMIDSTSGKMSASVTGTGYGFILFGICTELP